MDEMKQETGVSKDLKGPTVGSMTGQSTINPQGTINNHETKTCNNPSRTL